MTQQSIILIGGPTASGKSALAMELAREHKGAIINADAMQVYQGLPILTGQPAIQDKQEIPHFLYEITAPQERSSAGIWLIQAKQAIEHVLEEGLLPILVGGTGLYFDALLGGLADIPAIPIDTRQEAEALYSTWGEKKFRATLALNDPESARKIAVNDKQRLIRAFSVLAFTGRSLSDWQIRSKAQHALSLKELRIGDHTLQTKFRLLLPDREELYKKCDQRFSEMIKEGAIDEVKNLLNQELSPSLPITKILGVRELAAYLHNDISLEKAIALAQQMTRNYAKRQITWFRHRWRPKV